MTAQRHLRLVREGEKAPMDPFMLGLLTSLSVALIGGAAGGILGGWLIKKVFGWPR